MDKEKFKFSTWPWWLRVVVIVGIMLLTLVFIVWVVTIFSDKKSSTKIITTTHQSVKKDSAHIIRMWKRKYDSVQTILTARPMPVSKEYFDEKMDSLLLKMKQLPKESSLFENKKYPRRRAVKPDPDYCGCYTRYK